jgi:MFS family permease
VAWYLVGVLMLMYVFSFIDRQILGLLVDPIKHEFGVSDTQVGLLQGLTFAVFYCTLGIPMGLLADRFSRRWLVAIGVFLWSLMATACGLASSWVHLVIARMGVGVGEAALSPAAYSMIGDAFPRERLGRALAVYNTGISVGSALALILGGLVVNAVSQSGASYTLPLLGEVRAWQIVFIVTGAPGLLLCFLIFTVREPVRRGLLRAASGAAVAPVRFAETLRFTWERRGFFVVFFVAVGLLSIIGYGYLGWLPVALNRRFDMPIGDLAIINGLFTLFFNTTGIFMAGRIADALAARGIRDAALRVCNVIAAANGVWGTLGLLMPTLPLALAALALMAFTMSAYTGLVPLAINLVTPNQMRGQVAAIYLLVNNLIGLGIGPALMPFVSDHVIGDPAKVYLSMAIVTASCASGALLLFVFLRTRYARHVEEAAAWS